jgi:hypothetical protein
MLHPEFVHGSVSLLQLLLGQLMPIYLGCTVSRTRHVKLCRLI